MLLKTVLPARYEVNEMRVVILTALALMQLGTARPAVAQQKPLMSAALMEQLTRQHLAALPAKPYSDLIIWEEISPLLDEIERRGWDMPYREGLQEVMIGKSDFLSQFAQSRHGSKWLKASNSKLLLDRVDRISRVSGGQQTLKRVAKLPNGKQYARPKAGDFQPGLVELLPPAKYGRKRKIPDYNKPTGRAYTVDQVVDKISELHAEAELDRRRNVINNRR